MLLFKDAARLHFGVPSGLHGLLPRGYHVLNIGEDWELKNKSKK